ncbi:MAG: crotonase/enoyl-CoA hydratase family protein [Parasphingopyxis sp.]|uniref:crotonase/enoyl-CoA hydratase family protein n=1 Tax=Parasphingopyxis sp. TaxID=1920299 RepID=UPI003F9F96B3
MSDEVLTEASDGILTITINRPDAKNAVNRAVAEGIAAAIETLETDDSLVIGIITGAGGTFCSGMDLKAFLQGELPVVSGKGFAGFVEAPPAKPLIAAVDGYALAGGMEVAIACDLVVANKDAQFGIPEAKRGLAAGAGALLRLPRLIPQRYAMELALTGDFVSAGRAAEMGFVNRVVDGPALDGAKELAAKIAENGPLAVRASKEVIVKTEDWSHDEMWAEQQKIIGGIFQSEDAREGAMAFAQKRKPQWKGK